MFLVIIAILMQSISPVLAYAPQATSSGASQVAAACAVANRPVQMEMTYVTPHGKKTTWISTWPASVGEKYYGRDKIAILDLTVDASGKLEKGVVISSPDQKSGEFALAQYHRFHYRPAVKNCENVSSTFRTWYPVRTRKQGVISIVSASYPNGWSAAHPGSCRVPDLLHGGVPRFGMQVNRPLVTRVRVDVDAGGDVTNAAILSSSGNATFDNATLAAARGMTYPLNDSSGFKPVRPSSADLSWNATHGYSAFSKCRPLPTQYVWTANLKPAGSPLI